MATIACASSLVGFVPLSAAGGNHGTIQVPADFPTIQEAVDAAEPGDEIRVGPGEFCGAVVDKKVRLVGDGATIIGCPEPTVDGLRAGFFLIEEASGSSIERFRFDGEGVSNANLEPLSFAVFGRTVDEVIVERNDIKGTAQAITNTGGSGWQVLDNQMLDLTALTCEGPESRCGGGAGIVFQQRSALLDRAKDNIADGNLIRTAVPDGLDEFEMAGLFVQGQSGAAVKDNRVTIRDNPAATAFGVGVLVTDTCCGSPQPLPNSIDTKVIKNDGKGARFAVFVTVANQEGLVVRENEGRVVIGGELPVRQQASDVGDSLAVTGARDVRLSLFE